MRFVRTLNALQTTESTEVNVDFDLKGNNEDDGVVSESCSHAIVVTTYDMSQLTKSQRLPSLKIL